MIRRAEEKDLKRINDLLYQVHAVHADKRPDIFVPGIKKYTDEELHALIPDDTKPIFVWTDDHDETQGYAFCIFEEVKGLPNLQDMKTLYIDDICVEEKMRRRHIAADLYAFVKEFAAKNDCYRVTLNVWELNPAAMNFYRAMGMRNLKTTMEEIL